jgi:20S proteasome alpha/beta subunit
MTGFAADVQHLTRVTLKLVESHQMVTSHAMSVDRIVMALSSTVQLAALAEGGRPFGVQALVVGLDKNDKMLLYTVDPTGGWQHYGGGATAIGRGAEEVRTRLYKAIKDDASDDHSGAKAALRIAISALMEKPIKNWDDNDADKLEAILVWKSKNESCRLARIHDSEVDSCLQSVLDTK